MSHVLQAKVVSGPVFGAEVYTNSPCTPATGTTPHHVVFCNVEISPGVGGARPCNLVATQGGVEAVFAMGLLWGLLIGCVCGLATRRRRNRLNFDLSCEPQR